MKPLDFDHPHVQVIAEAGVNHNGDIGLALELVDAAADAGADYVKFQSFKAGMLATATAEKAAYQKTRTGGGSQQDMLARLELSREGHEKLIERCAMRGIRFLSSAFDPVSLDMLIDDLGLKVIKFGSGELTNGPLLYRTARKGVRMILSSGMATLGDIEEALALVSLAREGEGHSAPVPEQWRRSYADPEGQAWLRDNVAMLHCVTAYPVESALLNLRVIPSLQSALPVSIGYSDHSLGATASLAAVALGAKFIEKHITLDKGMEGPDHAASMDAAEFASLVREIRVCEAMLGSSVKRCHPTEQATARVARKSLVAARSIAAGETFTEANLTVKRPGMGVSPMLYWSYLGRTAARAYAEDELID